MNAANRRRRALCGCGASNANANGDGIDIEELVEALPVCSCAVQYLFAVAFYLNGKTKGIEGLPKRHANVNKIWIG